MSSGKKPAKPIAGQSRNTAPDPSIYGVQVRFVGAKGSASVCLSCGKETIRGMIRMLGERHYCSPKCAKSTTESAG